jgi:hypothetical protein
MGIIVSRKNNGCTDEFAKQQGRSKSFIVHDSSKSNININSFVSNSFIRTTATAILPRADTYFIIVLPVNIVQPHPLQKVFVQNIAVIVFFILYSIVFVSKSAIFVSKSAIVFVSESTIAHNDNQPNPGKKN